MVSQDSYEVLKHIKDNQMLKNYKVTLSMVSKFYLQIFMLLFVHGFVFWFFPINGNIKLQNHPYCVVQTSTTKDKINCNEFG